MRDIQQMRVFIKTVDSGNFSEAGRQLDLSPSSVSRKVAALEKDLNLRLLQRSTHGISLTETGHIFYKRAKQILSDIDDTYLSLSQLQLSPKGILRLNVSVEIGNLFIMPWINEFLMQYPDVQIDISMTNKLLNLVDNEIDLAVRFGSLQDSSLVIRKLKSTNRSILVASPEYFKTHGKPKNVNDLHNHNCLIYKFPRAHQWYFLDKKEHSHEIKVSGNFETDSGFAIRAALVSGLGVTICPEWLIRDEIKSGKLEIALPNLSPYQGSIDKRYIFAAYPNRQFLPLKVRAFLDFLISKVELEAESPKSIKSEANT